MPTLYLHIGRGKTGTTLIQGYLARNRRALLRQGVHYVYADDRGLGRGHQNLAKGFVTGAPDFMAPAVRPDCVSHDVLREIERKNLHTVILSSENFAIADVKAVRAYLAQLPDAYTVRILYFVRSQDEVAESEYNQVVKIVRETALFEHYARHKIEGLDYMAVASEWERHFGQAAMICRVFDGTKDVIGQFLACVPTIRQGALRDLAPSETRAAANASIGIRALTIARILNDVEIEDRAAMYARLFATLASVDLPALLFDSEATRDFRNAFAESNRAFTRRYLGHATGDLGGRRYSDAERDSIRAEIKRLGLGQ